MKNTPSTHLLQHIHHDVVICRLCPRLVAFRESVAPKPPFEHETYWHKPVPGFGDPEARLLILGLAPAPHGGNRTGRVFTGDLSGKFLIPALYRQGWANQPTSEYGGDTLRLNGCYMTAAVKCVPPQNKPTAAECSNCSQYLYRELEALKHLKGVLALGRVAFEAYIRYVKKQGKKTIPRLHFKHGGIYPFEGLPTLYASYHPTPRNVNTGTLTTAMFDSLLHRIHQDLFTRII